MDGCDDMEIAHQLGLALTTVRSYKVTARRKLKELTEEAGREAAARSRT
jgi:DNA-directed RNA polymerase specialized sigma24 family protein